MRKNIIAVLPIITLLSACNYKSNPVGLDPTYDPIVLTSFEEHPCYDLFRTYAEIKSLNEYTDYYYFKYENKNGQNDLEWTFGINTKTLEMSIKTLTKDIIPISGMTITYDCDITFKWGMFRNGDYSAHIIGEGKTPIDSFEIDADFINLGFNENLISIEADRDNFYQYNYCSFNESFDIGEAYMQKAFTKLKTVVRYVQTSILDGYETGLKLY